MKWSFHEKVESMNQAYQVGTKFIPKSKRIFEVLKALIPVVPDLINLDNLDFYANIGQAELALLSRSMSHDMRHVTWAGSLVNHHVTYVWGIITETI